MTKIRLLHITVGLEFGGAEKIMSYLVTHLDSHKYDVQVMILKGWGPIGESLKSNGIPVCLLNGKGWWDISMILRAYWFIRKGNFDLIHGHVLWANWIAALLKGKRRFIWHEHATGEWLNPFTRTITKWLIRRADCVIAISSAVAHDLVDKCPPIRNRLIVVPNTIPYQKDVILSKQEKADLRCRLYSWDDNRPIIGFVGRLEERFKGLEYFFRALPILSQRGYIVHAAIIGDGPDRSLLEEISKNLNLTKTVYFLGAQQNVQKFYPSFDIFVVPSVLEGFGLVILEAMVAGVPVVATAVGGIPEVVEDGKTGLLVPPRDELALANALQILLDHRQRARQMGKEGRVRLESHFNIQHAVAKLAVAYEKCLGA